MRKPLRALVFIGVLTGCDEEALVHPPPPPSTPVRELGAAAPLSAPSPASQPASSKVDDKPTTKMTLAALMEDYIEPTTRKAVKAKKADPALDALLRQLAALMPAELETTATGPKKTWATIIEATLAAPAGGVPKYGQSCKQCHVVWKKPYKKTFHKREIDVLLPKAADD